MLLLEFYLRANSKQQHSLEMNDSFFRVCPSSDLLFIKSYLYYL